MSKGSKIAAAAAPTAAAAAVAALKADAAETNSRGVNAPWVTGSGAASVV